MADVKKQTTTIGTPGQPWGAAEKQEWFASRTVKRSYKEEVVSKIDAMKNRFDVVQYGALPVDPERYPLFAVMSRNWDPAKPYVLVTGGVHGYETSGVQGAIQFLDTAVEKYSATYNICVLPCVSPWGYETIQRWNAHAVDPNRSFSANGEVVAGRTFNPEAATDESSAVMSFLDSLGVQQWLCHFDCHETTDTDVTEFSPMKASRDGLENELDSIPDGFYLVCSITNPQPAWHTAMIDGVRKVTHIAPADSTGKIIGLDVLQEGVIAVPCASSDAGFCFGVTNATYATTTEVYPDSPKATAEQCNLAQIACICSGLDYLSAL